MKYKMINEELQIASCRLSELTLGEVENFLKQWEPGTSLDTLTMFFDKNSGDLVINADSEHYSEYVDIAEGYLSADCKRRLEIRRNAPEGMFMTMKLLEDCVQCRSFNERAFRAINNEVRRVERKYIDMLIERYNPISAVYIAYKSGVIRGKRVERAKKKKGGTAA